MAGERFSSRGIQMTLPHPGIRFRSTEDLVRLVLREHP